MLVVMVALQERLDLLLLRAMENANARHKANSIIDLVVKTLSETLQQGVVGEEFFLLKLTVKFTLYSNGSSHCECLWMCLYLQGGALQ